MKRDARFFLVLFLLVLLVAGGALFSLNPRFTGFVTNVDNGSSINSFEFSNGSFQSTKFPHLFMAHGGVINDAVVGDTLTFKSFNLNGAGFIDPLLDLRGGFSRTNVG